MGGSISSGACKPACQFGVGEPGPTEEIQGTANGKINGAPAKIFNDFDVFHGVDATGVGNGNLGPLAEQFDKGLFNALASAFHIHGMNQEFIAETGQMVQQGRCYHLIGEGLPAVCYDPVTLSLSAAAQIQHQAFFTDALHKLFQSFFIHCSVMEHP